MPEPTARHWHPAAAYLYTLHLDGPSLAWEYLRRNPDYGRDWRHYRSRPIGNPGRRWGMRWLENPERDARDAQPDWLPDPDNLVLVLPDTDTSNEAQPFRLWLVPGHKRLTYDGKRLLLTSNHFGRMLRMAISLALEDGMAYAYAVRAGVNLRERWRAIETVLAMLDTVDEDRTALARSRPGRAPMLHMRTLQALDGTLAGASQREIAQALFGATTVAQRWHDDSDLRAQVRRLIRRGQAFMGGAYRQLLHFASTEQGR